MEPPEFSLRVEILGFMPDLEQKTGSYFTLIYAECEKGYPLNGKDISVLNVSYVIRASYPIWLFVGSKYLSRHVDDFAESRVRVYSLHQVRHGIFAALAGYPQAV